MDAKLLAIICVLLIAELPLSFGADADDRLKNGSEKFLALVDKQPGVIKLLSGLRYVVMQRSENNSNQNPTGPLPKLDTKCKVRYKGWYPVSAFPTLPFYVDYVPHIYRNAQRNVFQTAPRQGGSICSVSQCTHI
jgi:hypothetical protein